MDLEAETSKKGKISPSDDSESDAEAVPEWHPRSSRKYSKIPISGFL